MRRELADKLLAKVLEWEPEDVSKNLANIEMLSRLKYDEYQQFFPGMRFTESLAIWLNQFRTVEERKKMLELVLNKLIYISNKEMNELVSQVYPDNLRHHLIDVVANQLGKSKYSINQIVNTNDFRFNLRKTLFLGLSDGARTDVIRRYNPFISHEQLLPFYLVPDEKIEELLKELKLDLDKIDSKLFQNDDNKFHNLVLLDDFTASGTSYFKFDGSKFRGKVNKILNKISGKDKFRNLFNLDKLNIFLIIYISTSHAINVINDAIKSWEEENGKIYNRINFQAVYELPKDIKIVAGDTQTCEVLKEYYDSSIETNSYKKGKHDHPYLGFDECGLPLILHHNTPNNSLPILWNERSTDGSGGFVGLFPRVSRHKT
ncbi:phosphoribosyltransferase-like protein [Gracilimonas tropica]|uniref:phosphoribosyltransferase-like protein n=1 Tax=Gracilimonas tropica TaxID=454600 RepID=UPI000369E657|nr:hypothetical protein [Gracilimonas tropica]